MDNLEICKRIAEIEGLMPTHTIGWVEVDNKPYNPLTDDALCFQLMIKYRVRIVYEIGPDFYRARVNGLRCEYSTSEKPNKAICLAIIEAHKK